jgi:hypothetical protein
MNMKQIVRIATLIIDIGGYIAKAIRSFGTPKKRQFGESSSTLIERDSACHIVHYEEEPKSDTNN